MTPLSEKNLEEIRKRTECARPGPWKSYIEGRDHEAGSNYIQVSDNNQEMSTLEFSGKVTEADQDFIAHAREDIPALLSEIERLKAGK
jgi:type II secretory pathway component PulJ